jgi:hypothetical protein
MSVARKPETFSEEMRHSLIADATNRPLIACVIPSEARNLACPLIQSEIPRFARNDRVLPTECPLTSIPFGREET